MAELDVPTSASSPRCRDTLLALLRTGATQAERRAAAQDLAAELGAGRALAAALRDERQPAVQAAILAALVCICTDDAAAGVANAICARDATLRNAAALALRQFGALALPHITRLLESPNTEERIVGVGLLDAHTDAGTREALSRILTHDPDINVGLAAVEMLSSIGNTRDIPVLRAFQLRFEDDPFVSFAVDVACRRAALGDPP